MEINLKFHKCLKKFLFSVILKKGAFMRNWLREKTVILTGASGGIGRALCKMLICKYDVKVIGIGSIFKSSVNIQSV